MMSSGVPLYLNRAEVQKCLYGKLDVLIDAVENALVAFSSGSVIIQPVRSAINVDKHDGLFLTMPAYSLNDESLAVKLVSVYPNNKELNLPAVQATVLLYDSSTGSLKAILDGDVITNMRTAAASAVATKYLVQGEPKILAILGAGNQARSHYQVLTHLYKFSEIRIWNVNPQSATSLVNEVSEEDGVRITRCDSVQNAVANADIIVTATMSQTPILKKEWVKSGAHINAVGAPVPTWQEISEDLMRSAIVYVDSREGALAESGDIIKSKAEIHAEIGEVIYGSKNVVKGKTTIFKSLGMAVEDLVTAKLILEDYRKS